MPKEEIILPLPETHFDEIKKETTKDQSWLGGMAREEPGTCFLSRVLALRVFTCFYSKRKTHLVTFTGNLVLSSLPYYSLAARTFQFKCLQPCPETTPPVAASSHSASKNGHDTDNTYWDYVAYLSELVSVLRALPCKTRWPADVLLNLKKHHQHHTNKQKNYYLSLTSNFFPYKSWWETWSIHFLNFSLKTS